MVTSHGLRVPNYIVFHDSMNEWMDEVLEYVAHISTVLYLYVTYYVYSVCL